MRRAATFPCRCGAIHRPCGCREAKARRQVLLRCGKVEGGAADDQANRFRRPDDRQAEPSCAKRCRSVDAPGVHAAGSRYSRAWGCAIGGECDEAIAMPNRCRCGHASASMWAINPGRSVECTWFHPLVYAMRWMLCRPRLIVEQGNISKRHATRAATARSPRRYPIASATCGPRMSVLPARSAIVRATRRMRCIERAESCRRSIAFSNIA